MMDQEALFAELKQTLEKLGVEVREQSLDLDAGRAKSGMVRIRGKKIALLDSALALEDKVKTLTSILREFDLGGVYLSPFLRKWIEDEDEKKF